MQLWKIWLLTELTDSIQNLIFHEATLATSLLTSSYCSLLSCVSKMILWTLRFEELQGSLGTIVWETKLKVELGCPFLLSLFIFCLGRGGQLCFGLVPLSILQKQHEQWAAHFLLQDLLVFFVVIATRDEGGEEDVDEAWVTKVLEWETAQLLEKGWGVAGLDKDLVV